MTGTKIALVNPSDNQMQVIGPQMPSFADVERMAQAVAKSQLFGMKTPDQAMVLMLLAQAEGMHPMIAARDYDIIQGRPSKKAEAMLRDFQRAGGKVEWHELTDTKADATFSHPQGGSFRCDWDIQRAITAGLGGKDMWKKYPRQMLRARCVSEGCKTVWPSATSGLYTPEETIDFEPAREPRPEPRAPLVDADRPVREVKKPERAKASDKAPENTEAEPVAEAETGELFELRNGQGEVAEMLMGPVYVAALDTLWRDATKLGSEQEFVAVYEHNADEIAKLPDDLKDIVRKSYAEHKKAFGKKK